LAETGLGGASSYESSSYSSSVGPALGGATDAAFGESVLSQGQLQTAAY